jgi:hypothetical protein
MARPIYFFFLILLTASCYHRQPKSPYDISLVVPPDTMVAVLTEIHLLEGVVGTIHLKDTGMTSVARQDYDIILEKHKMDRRSFEESIHYYAYHAEELDRIYEKVIINLAKLESEMAVPKDTTEK